MNPSLPASFFAFLDVCDHIALGEADLCRFLRREVVKGNSVLPHNYADKLKTCIQKPSFKCEI